VPDGQSSRTASPRLDEAGGWAKLFDQLARPRYGYQPDNVGRIEYVRGVDRDATDYVAEASTISTTADTA